MNNGKSAPSKHLKQGNVQNPVTPAAEPTQQNIVDDIGDDDIFHFKDFASADKADVHETLSDWSNGQYSQTTEGLSFQGVLGMKR
jgi:hypothetical protein